MKTTDLSPGLNHLIASMPSFFPCTPVASISPIRENSKIEDVEQTAKPPARQAGRASLDSGRIEADHDVENTGCAPVQDFGIDSL